MTDTLKSICEQCVHLRDPQLDFLPDESLPQRAIILRDVGELRAAAFAEKEKSVVLLTGVLFESVLYCFIHSQRDYIAARRGAFDFRPDNSLSNFVSTFNRWFSDLLSLPDVVVGYRDMVHINRELQQPPDICSRAAREMLRLLDGLFEALSKYTAA